MSTDQELPPLDARAMIRSEKDHLFFTRYFFKHRQNNLFRVNWHHHYIADEIEKVIKGETKNIIFNVSPGSSKTEQVVINFIARGLALNPRARFLHISYADDLALLNSQTARDLIQSEEYQKLWPLTIAPDSKAKNRWNVMSKGKKAGGVYAVSLGGQITGFRAGHMAEGFQGAILIDDPLKPEDAYSEARTNQANRKLLSTVMSRKANPDTPIILIMQRIGEKDPTAFIKNGNVPGIWKHIVIPAMIDDEYVKTIPQKYHAMIDSSVRDVKGRFSYWEYKEPIKTLNEMEQGSGADQTGSKMSRQVFSAQYQQNPVAIGGNIIRGEWFERYSIKPQISYRKIFADTAQKTKERNDYSVFACYGLGKDKRLYLLDQIRGKWEAPELKKRALAFWAKHQALDVDEWGQLRQMVVEDKSSGTGLLQDIKTSKNIPIKGLERTIDKLTRVMDVTAYIESKCVLIPEEAPFVNDFVSECEAFTADDTHAFDDQIDPLVDAINDMISTSNKLKLWENLGEQNQN